MSPVLPVALLALAAAVLAWLVLSEGPGAPPESDELDRRTEVGPAPAPETRTDARAMVASLPRATVELVPPGAWDGRRLALPRPITDPRILGIEIRSPDGAEWALTGAGLLDVLAERLPDVPVRFRDAASLEAFRARAWPAPVPGRVDLALLLVQCADVGFPVTLRDGALYVVPMDDTQPPAPQDEESEGEER